MWQHYTLVFLGGGIGAVMRYWLSAFVPRHVESVFPYGILLVNVLGCFFIGVLMSWSEDRLVIDPAIRVFLAIGILGGFTTFSTFSYETIALLRDSEYWLAGLYVAGSVLFGLTATYLGSVLGKLI